MKKIGNYLKNMGWLGLPASVMRLDLQQHAIVGLFLIIPGYIFPMFSLKLSMGLSFIIAVALSTIVGVGKEIRDKVTKKGTPDPLDAVATIGATIIGSALLMLLL